MSAPVAGGGGLAPAFAAVRVRLGLVAALFALAGIGWWWTAERMRGMDEGPWTSLGTLGWFLGVWVVMMAAMMFPSVSPTVALFALAGIGWWWTAERMRGMDQGPWTSLGALGWFLGVWVVMMAAMMFPSVSPTVALYARMTQRRSPLSPFLFVAGYLTIWAGAGLCAYVLMAVLGRTSGNVLAWDQAGRWVAGVTLVVAAVYELTPLKDVCLGKCSSPLGFLLGAWRDGRWGALRMGAKHGAWCVGCCWALMASLFALGVMSVTWMAFVAGLIAVEKTLPWRRVVTYGTAVVLLALGVLILIAPDGVPALTVPGTGEMAEMESMGSYALAD